MRVDQDPIYLAMRDQRDKAQRQLAEAVELLREIYGPNSLSQQRRQILMDTARAFLAAQEKP